MKWMQHPLVAAAGLSFLCCLGWMGPLVSPLHLRVYHDCGTASAIYLPVLVNMGLLWVGFSILLATACRPGRWRVLVWSGQILFTPWLLLDARSGWDLPHGLGAAIFLASAGCWLGINLLWRSSFTGLFERIQRFSSAMLSTAALLAVVVAGQLLGAFREARQLGVPRALHVSSVSAATGVRSSRARVIWVILDELSYQQLYERRFPSLDLPAFDQLAGQSTVFTHVMPAAFYTDQAVPSLMTGRGVDSIRANADGTLDAFRDPESGQWQAFNARDTVFEDALDAGYRTAIAGWFNPYCRILAQVLDQCQWAMREDLGDDMFSDASVEQNLLSSWVNPIRRLRRHGWGGGENTADSTRGQEAHIADYRDIVAGGDRFLRDASVDFLLLHLPVPHPGGIYDRRTGTFTTHMASYIDNLALADRYLAHVRQVLEERGEWNSSAVVVMGDHSWRTRVWRGAGVWTADDEAASHGGQFDDRPGYIVKLPYQTAAARIETPFAAVRTRAMLDGILDGRIRSVEELEGFAEQAPVKGRQSELFLTRAEAGEKHSHAR